MSRERAPRPDPAVVCAALERAIARWDAMITEQGNREEDMGKVHAGAIGFLFRPKYLAVSPALRRLQADGLVARHVDSRYGPAWSLTIEGEQLAQSAEPPCESCIVMDALPRQMRCGECEAGSLEQRAEDNRRAAEHWRAYAAEHEQAAAEQMARAAQLRADLAA